MNNSGTLISGAILLFRGLCLSFAELGQCCPHQSLQLSSLEKVKDVVGDTLCMLT